MIQEFRILSCFAGQDSCHFVEICRAVDLPTDLGGYYIRGLVKGGFLTRSDRGTYTLTPKGKQELAVSRDNEPFVSRPRLCVMIVATHGGKFITLQRTRQPFIGALEWPAGSIGYGESIPAAAERLLLHRLGAEGAATPAGFFRRIDMYHDMVFDDKLFALHTFTVPAGDIIKESGDTGKNLLYDAAELPHLPALSKSLLDILAYISAGKSDLVEYTYQLEPKDLFLE